MDGTRFNNRLVKDLKKDLDSNFLSWMASLDNKDEKGVNKMKKIYRKVKVFFKSGIEMVVKFWKENKTTIIRLSREVFILIFKTTVKLFFDNLF